MRSIQFPLILVGFTLLFYSCNKNSESVNAPAPTPDPVSAVLNLPAAPFNYANMVLPAYLNTPNILGQVNTPQDNPITNDGATLGRVLFYDRNLSLNNSISCASCHKQQNAFTDPVRLSAGFNGGSTGRNSMTLVNARYYPNGRFFWDQRANTLEIQTLMPIQDHVEMGLTLAELEDRIRALSYYPPLFTRAFGNGQISSDRISRALSQFIRSIVSYQSKYDMGRSAFPGGPIPPNAVFANFTAQENRGKEIFLSPLGGCSPCHGSETFTAPSEKNNGLDMLTIDRGFGAVTNNPVNDAQFKVGTLRNIELTGPYMHDGRFNSLEEVVEHYSSGVRNHPTLSPQLRLLNGQPKNLNLTAGDKAALVAFLKTLTDQNLVTDVKYSNPFR